MLKGKRLEVWRNSSIGSSLDLETDQRGLEVGFNKHSMNSVQEEWVSLVSEAPSYPGLVGLSPS